MIVVKSAVAYRAAYMPIAAAVIEMDTAGLCSANLSALPVSAFASPGLSPGLSCDFDGFSWVTHRVALTDCRCFV